MEALDEMLAPSLSVAVAEQTTVSLGFVVLASIVRLFPVAGNGVPLDKDQAYTGDNTPSLKSENPEMQVKMPVVMALGLADIDVGLLTVGAVLRISTVPDSEMLAPLTSVTVMVPVKIEPTSYPLFSGRMLLLPSKMPWAFRHSQAGVNPWLSMSE